jgi:hypothetical protein
MRDNGEKPKRNEQRPRPCPPASRARAGVLPRVDCGRVGWRRSRSTKKVKVVVVWCGLKRLPLPSPSGAQTGSRAKDR